MPWFDQVEIPYGCYWSTPFVKWQGALQHLHAGRLASYVARAELASRAVDPKTFDFGVLGQTVAQFQSFQGAPWALAEAGLNQVTGPILSQVCSTGARALLTVAAEVQLGMATAALALTADRCSNGPHIYYPAPSGTGGTGQSEDVVLYNFSHDALADNSMLQTAENVAAKFGIETEEQHAVVLMRTAQYQAALADDQAFQRRYMALPFAVPTPNFHKIASTLTGDDGIIFSTVDGLARLKPVLPGGTVTFGGQTHPADGNAAMIVATPDIAKSMSTDPAIRIRILGFGQARADQGYMPEAPIRASQCALTHAGVGMAQVHAVKSHNPFAVNDIAFARETGFPLAKMNNYGCSLIWGHPQGPTGTRAIIELIEELAVQGGGIGLFQGCAAGDSSLACVIEVSDR